MLTTEELGKRILSRKYELSVHALRRITERDISRDEILQASRFLELIEDYPNDKYGPSCLLLGLTLKKRPIHFHVSRLDRVKVKIITLYQPTPDEWFEYRIRKSKL
jgi:hypothetical protein